VAVVIAAAVAVILVLALGGSDSKSGPTEAVDKLLTADVHNDLKAAQAVTCDPLKSQLSGGDPDKSYKIGKTTQKDKSATVTATIVDSDNKSHGILFIVQKQDDGSWKVCDAESNDSGSGGSSSGANGPGATDLPSGVPTDFPSGFPTDLPSGAGTDFPSGGGSSICFTPNGQSPICVP
jgi:hypothetical protein